MPFVPVPNTIAVDVVYLYAGQRVENTLYFERGDGWDTTSITTFLNDLQAWISQELMPVLSQAIQFIELAARLLDTASSIGIVNTVSPVVSGGVAGDAVSNNVSYTVSFRTGLTGRSFRGRNYVPGIPVTSVASNTIGAGFRTALLAYYTGLMALGVDNGITWVVVSRFSGVDSNGDPIPRVTGVTTPIVSVGTFDTTVDSQRRRLPGRGT